MEIFLDISEFVVKIGNVVMLVFMSLISVDVNDFNASKSSFLKSTKFKS